MIVVSDTSPLNYLVLIGRADILPALFDRVIAPAVLAEMLQSGAPAVVVAWADTPPPWLEIIAPSAIDRNLPLGLGEIEAIALAQELRTDTVLLDERKAVKVARRLGLQVTGTLGVLDLAAERGMLILMDAIDALRQTTRAPEKLIAELLRRDQSRRAPDGT